MLDRLIFHRRNLHQIPEIDFDLPETCQYITDALQNLSCNVFFPTKSSVCAYFDKDMPHTVAFRADMDALPVTEQTGLPFSSRHEGFSHSCGHDGHMAMALCMAEYVDKANDLPCNVLLVFQPAEETTGGAEALVNSGIFKQYNVSRIFGCHLWPELPASVIGSKKGALMAQNSEIDVTVAGKSSHIAKADQGADALYALSLFLTRTYQMERDVLPSDVPRLVKFGCAQSGTTRNALSSESHMLGSIRTFSKEDDDLLKSNMVNIAKQIDKETGCTTNVEFLVGYPPLINDPHLFDAVMEKHADEIVTVNTPSMTCEDFSFYGQAAPSFFFFLGVGGNEPLHSQKFNFDEACLLTGFDFFKKLLYL